MPQSALELFVAKVRGNFVLDPRIDFFAFEWWCARYCCGVRCDPGGPQSDLDIAIMAEIFSVRRLCWSVYS